MLVQFNFGNYLSFNKIQSLRMTKTEGDVEYSINNAFIYGANASGKSNFIDAFRFSKMAIISGKIPKDNCSFRGNKQDPSYFEFILDLDGFRYSYGFEYDFNNKYYQSEWLHILTDHEDEVIFEWSYKGDAPHFDPDSCEFTSTIDGFTLDVPDFIETDLFLKYGSNLDPRIKIVYSWFDLGLTVKLAQEPYDSTIVPDDYLSFLKKYLRLLGIRFTDVVLTPFEGKNPSSGIESIYLNIPNSITYYKTKSNQDTIIYTVLEDGEVKRYTLSLSHESNGCCSLNLESTGTIRIIQLLTFLAKQKLYNNGLLAIDEIECSLHPLVMEAFIDIFKTPEYQNIQLVLTTHEQVLMNPDYAGMDSIWFIKNNNPNEGSKLYSLRSFGAKVQNYNQLYFDGKFSATPSFTDFNLEDE